MFVFVKLLKDNSINIVDLNLTTSFFTIKNHVFINFHDGTKMVDEEVIMDSKTEMIIVDSYFKRKKLFYKLSYEVNNTIYTIELKYNSSTVFYNMRNTKIVKLLEEKENVYIK